ncbi:hypothetical protein GOP80_05700 [Planococcaceae bacterium Storch 2/2-2]|nr:hypothetical protein [Planococcaceae bacterium Storch 2/2-2]
MERPVEREMNIFTDVWTKPRATTASFIEHGTMKMVRLLIIMSGALAVWTELLSEAAKEGWAENIVLIVFIGMVVSPIISLFSWWVSAWITYGVGKMLGGSGTVERMKYALAMPQVVAIVMNVWTLIFFASYGYGLFVPEIAEAQGASPFGLLLYGLVAFTLGIWSVVISVAAIAEAHRFSIVRAVLTSILPGILIAVVILALAFGIGIMFV